MNEHKAMLTLPIAPIVLTIYLFLAQLFQKHNIC